ncbi:MAG: class I SAM-dependent methyltransferase, partial [Gemmatimonadota bacterium]|nr:class I SAM-dependent methyltransferase [Gemmatimonadota bacterium]
AHRDAERVQSVLSARHTTSQKFFASSAGQWDKLRAELFGQRAEFLALLGMLDAEWTVADLGCGTGQLAGALSPFVKRVIAIDESAAMLRAARARLPNNKNVDVRQGTLEELPLANGEADVAVLSLVLQYIAEPGELFARIRRALAPGGRLIILDLVAHERADLREQMGHVWQGFDSAQIVGWANDAGFKRTTVAEVPTQPAAANPGVFVAVARI